MGRIRVAGLGKAYKQYHHRWSRLAEWLLPWTPPRHRLKWVLADVSFEIAAGEAVAVIGCNGAGKSTLLKLITGTAQPTAGTVDTSGRVAALLELGMGFHPDFSGRQNALMAGQLIGLGIAETEALMPQIEAFAEIGDYIDQPLRVYSSGMQVRLAFAVATAVRPSILVVDEALAVGDVFFQQKCFDRIRAFCQAGTTLLFVSHAMGAVYSLCNRAILIHEGRVALDASPREVIDLYNAQVLHQQAGAPAATAIVEESPPLPAAGAPAAAAGSAEPASPIGSFTGPEAAISAVEFYVDGRAANTVVSEAAATVRVRVRFAEPLEDPHIGFQIRNARGEAVFMTNTYCMRRRIGPVQRGEEVVAEFSFAAGLAPGDYTLTAGVADGGVGETEFRRTLTRHHDATAFTVLRNMDAILWSGVYNLDPRCSLQRLGRD